MLTEKSSADKPWTNGVHFSYILLSTARLWVIGNFISIVSCFWERRKVSQILLEPVTILELSSNHFLVVIYYFFVVIYSFFAKIFRALFVVISLITCCSELVLLLLGSFSIVSAMIKKATSSTDNLFEEQSITFNRTELTVFVLNPLYWLLPLIFQCFLSALCPTQEEKQPEKKERKKKDSSNADEKKTSHGTEFMAGADCYEKISDKIEQRYVPEIKRLSTDNTRLSADNTRLSTDFGRVSTDNTQLSTDLDRKNEAHRSLQGQYGEQGQALQGFMSTNTKLVQDIGVARETVLDYAGQCADAKEESANTKEELNSSLIVIDELETKNASQAQELSRSSIVIDDLETENASLRADKRKYEEDRNQEAPAPKKRKGAEGGAIPPNPSAANGSAARAPTARAAAVKAAAEKAAAEKADAAKAAAQKRAAPKGSAQKVLQPKAGVAKKKKK